MLNKRIVLVAVAAIVLAGAAFAVWKSPSRKAAGPVEYAMLAPTDIPTTVAAAPDGDIWFTIDFGEGVGLVRDGKVQRVPKAGGRNVEPIGLGIDSSGANGPATWSSRRPVFSTGDRCGGWRGMPA